LQYILQYIAMQYIVDKPCHGKYSHSI